MEVFAVGNNGVVNHIWQKTAGSSATTNWATFATFSFLVSTTAKLTIGNWANGTLDLFVVGTDNVLYHNYQTAPNGGWFGFVALAGSWQQDGNTGNVYHNYQSGGG